jgi:intracellular septation protein A
MFNLQTENKPGFSRRAIRIRILFTLIYAVVVPFLIYRVATSRFHLSVVNALLLAALAPALGSLIEFVRKRQLSVLGLFAFAGIGAKVASALLFHDPHLVLISDSLLSGVIGLLLLGSVLIGKPVTVMLVTNMYAASPEQRAQMKQRLQASGAHRHVLLLTAMWGVGMLLLPVISVLLTYTLPIAPVVLIRPVIDYGMIAALAACTIAYGFVVRKRWQRAR